MNDAKYPGLHGLVDQLPRMWTVEQRARWMSALELVLDYSVKIKTPVAQDDNDEPEYGFVPISEIRSTAQ